MFKANIDEIGPEFPGQLFNIEIYNFLQELTRDFRKGVGVGVEGGFTGNGEFDIEVKSENQSGIKNH